MARQPTGPDRVQMNVRLPRDLLEQIDARRAVKDLSRDKWVERALRFALDQHPAARTVSNTKGRTAPPPHTRT